MNENLSKVQKYQLFVGSGVEDIYDNKLQTTLNRYGQYGSDLTKSSNENVARIILNSNQSKSEKDLADSAFSKLPKRRFNDSLGYYTSLYVGHATKDGFRKRGSSGGFVSWVAVKLLESGRIDGFIHVKKASKQGILFEYGISHTAAEIKNGAKSRYYPVELSKVLKEVRNTPGRYAVVGIPEIITELRLLAENDEMINSRIKYYFGLVCGHQKTTKYAEAIAWEYGIHPGELKDIDFRVKKNTGSAIEYDMKFTGNIDGQKRTFIVRNNEPFVSSWAHGFFKAKFSDFTDNTFNENADITFGDAWLDEYVGDPMGHNILIVRNAELETLINNGAKNNEIDVDVVDEETIIRSQQGLIHHTRDELPYRLYKHRKRYGWAPRKRLAPSSSIDTHRKRVQDARQEIAEKSHIYYAKAVAKNDFSYFKSKMQPYVNEYRKLYSQSMLESNDGVKADGAILTLTGYFNYGNVIQRYALQKFLKKHGLNFVSYVDPYSAPQALYKINKRIIVKTPLRALKRFLNYQKPYWYIPKYGDIHPEAKPMENIIQFVNNNVWIKPFNPNDNYQNYIVGSDQVWRDWWGDREILGYYFLNFLRGRKVNRIGYAVSFGKDKISEVMSQDSIAYVKPYLQRFNKISVREKSGRHVLEKTWGIEGVDEVVDPVLLLDESDYSKLIDKSDVKYEKIQPIFSYVLGETPAIKEFIRNVQDQMKVSLTSVRAHSGSEGDILPPVELWLKGFRDAELVITNSFHGLMFAIMNNTNFVVIGRRAGGLSRIKDVLSKYQIEGRFVDEAKLKNFNSKNLKPIDWQNVNQILHKSKKASQDWLLEAVNGK